MASFRPLFPPYLDRINPYSSVHDYPQFIKLMLIYNAFARDFQTKNNTWPTEEWEGVTQTIKMSASLLVVGFALQIELA